MTHFVESDTRPNPNGFFLSAACIGSSVIQVSPEPRARNPGSRSGRVLICEPTGHPDATISEPETGPVRSGPSEKMRRESAPRNRLGCLARGAWRNAFCIQARFSSEPFCADSQVAKKPSFTESHDEDAGNTSETIRTLLLFEPVVLRARD
jgi:hypothetical protein